MARARNIKPGFFKNEKLAEMDPLGRILFAGLWCLADREGRLEDRPKRIKVEVLPYDDCDVDKLLQELHDRGFIRRYQVGEGRYIAIVNFYKHQSPHIKEAASEIPAPESTGKAPEIPVQESDEHEKSRPDSHDSHDSHDSLNSDSHDSCNVGQADNAPPESKPSGNGKAEPEIPYAEIIGHLNQLAGTAYRPGSKVAKKHIRARWSEGFRLPDFLRVIEKKVREWHGTEMAKFLRPETLFGTKFESYLNQPEPVPGKPRGDPNRLPRAYQSIQQYVEEGENDPF